jgi:hypothetical protein
MAYRAPPPSRKKEMREKYRALQRATRPDDVQADGGITNAVEAGSRP